MTGHERRALSGEQLRQGDLLTNCLVPLFYLQVLAGTLGPRCRLQSPFLEHLSQAFARFFYAGWFASSDPDFQKMTPLRKYHQHQRNRSCLDQRSRHAQFRQVQE
jgi:hypothetical protein